MKRMIALLIMVIGASAMARAQEAPVPAWDGGGAFSILSIGGDNDSDFDLDRRQQFGWQADGALNASRMLGLAGNVAGQYRAVNALDTHSYQYLFGPRLNFRGDKGTTFVHAMLGGVNFGNEMASENGFGMGFGGGMDVNVNDGLAVRLFQIDWIPNRLDGNWHRDVLRYGFGVVFKGGN